MKLVALLIEDVRVASHCRSRGIGEQLVQWAVTEARARASVSKKQIIVTLGHAGDRLQPHNDFLNPTAHGRCTKRESPRR